MEIKNENPEDAFGYSKENMYLDVEIVLERICASDREDSIMDVFSYDATKIFMGIKILKLSLIHLDQNIQKLI